MSDVKGICSSLLGADGISSNSPSSLSTATTLLFLRSRRYKNANNAPMDKRAITPTTIPITSCFILGDFPGVGTDEEMVVDVEGAIVLDGVSEI